MSQLRLPYLLNSGNPATLVGWTVKAGGRAAAGDPLATLDTGTGLLLVESPGAFQVTRLIAIERQTLEPGAVLLEYRGAAPQTPPSREASPMTPAPSPESEAVPILMPQAGNSMEEGTLLKWHVKEGDRVTVGDIIAEIETDKSTMELEAEQDGRIARLVAKEGDIVAVKEPIAYLGEGDVEAPQAASAPAAAPSSLEPLSSGDVTPILMPQAGNSMEEGTLLKWHVKEGDRVATGDILAEIETDKSSMELEAEQEGRIARLVAKEGDIVAVKEPIALLAESDAAAEAYLVGGSSSAPETTQPAAVATRTTPPAPATAPAPQTATGRIKASPAARKLAKDRGVDLSTLGTGSGPGGRIMTGDVAGASPSARLPMPPVAGGATSRPLSRMRRAIARNLVASKQTVPHFYMKLTIDADPMFQFYRVEKAKYPLSLNDVLVAGCARALREFPGFRTRLEGDNLVEYPGANIGIAVGMDEGLVVPVVVGADALSLPRLAERTRAAVESARNGKVEAQGEGVFTISNLGMFGVEEFTAIINPPESAILAVGGMREEVIVRDGMMRPGHTMAMTLSADHRVVDGLLAAKFLARLRELLENPFSLLN